MKTLLTCHNTFKWNVSQTCCNFRSYQACSTFIHKLKYMLIDFRLCAHRELGHLILCGLLRVKLGIELYICIYRLLFELFTVLVQ